MTASRTATSRRSTVAVLLTILAIWLSVPAAAAGVHDAKSLAEARQLAAQTGSLIVVDSFGPT